MKLRDIKMLVDENISSKVTAFIRQNKIDVLDTKEQNWYGTEDKELLEIVFQQQRFILTHDSDSDSDSDFGTLSINEGKRYYGIIYLRLKNVNPRHIIKVCDNLLRLNTPINDTVGQSVFFGSASMMGSIMNHFPN
jgi:predicted nuclease of predicted toxin-antitoxin system